MSTMEAAAGVRGYTVCSVSGPVREDMRVGKAKDVATRWAKSMGGKGVVVGEPVQHRGVGCRGVIAQWQIVSCALFTRSQRECRDSSSLEGVATDPNKMRTSDQAPNRSLDTVITGRCNQCSMHWDRITATERIVQTGEVTTLSDDWLQERGYERTLTRPRAE